jgi:TolB-like protein
MEEFREDLAAMAEGLKPLKAKARPAAIKLAVLPFVNLTGDPEQEYLSDGLTQEMITLLGRLHPESLGVIARTSVMRYKQTDTPIDQIGRELGVEYVLEGSARREGSRVRVSADLIQVRDQTQLWGDAFEREMAGILACRTTSPGKWPRPGPQAPAVRTGQAWPPPGPSIPKPTRPISGAVSLDEVDAHGSGHRREVSST